jgi:hypothetical protein
VNGSQAYEEKFRPMATANHGGSQWFEDLAFPRSAFAIGILHAFAGVAAYLRLDLFANVDSRTSKWQLPEYPELDTDRGQ